MNMYDIIEKKKLSHSLSKEEIAFLVDGYTNGEIPDYQMSAFLMAVYFNGMNEEETAILTEAMRDSGDVLDLSEFGNTVDKHSTGGVGDKTSLVVCPIAASLGCKIAKMSGRGLGHTGGTVDKLESIKGYKTALTSEEFSNQVHEIGITIAGQSGNLAPADKKIYALRDVTATVDCIPLIASSIMSKKLAAGSSSIVLDVKVGSGAFMKTPEEAEILAKTMVDIGEKCGKKVRALLTNMDVPLGNAVGNAVEVLEAVEILKGKGSEDLRELCIELSANMVSLCKDIDLNSAKEQVITALNSGAALEKFKEWMLFQGAEDVSFIDNPQLLCPAKFEKEILSDFEGYISHIDTEKVGRSASMLGAGRETLLDTIDFSAGIILNKKTGDFVKKGDVLALMKTSKEELFANAETSFKSALTFSDIKPKEIPIVYKTV